MDIRDWSAATGIAITVTYVAASRKGWCSDIEDCDLGEPGCVRSICGDGETPDEAIHSLVAIIAGQRIVEDWAGKNPRIFDVPKSLSYTPKN